LCGHEESAKHIFVQCVVARLCWSIIRYVLEWSGLPVCMEDLIGKLIEGTNITNIIFIFMFGCLAWSHWLIRNDFVFNEVITSSPDVVIFRTISFMQKWKILRKEKDQPWINAVITKLKLRVLSLWFEEWSESRIISFVTCWCKLG
jgi:hypothetical protein